MPRTARIALDFDGTLVSNFDIDNDNTIGHDIGAVGPLLEAQETYGCRYYLWTIRPSGFLLQKAQYWIEETGLSVEIPTLRVDKPKVDLFIDDRALCTPLRPDDTGKPCVDWAQLEPLLFEWLSDWYDR